MTEHRIWARGQYGLEFVHQQLSSVVGAAPADFTAAARYLRRTPSAPLPQGAAGQIVNAVVLVPGCLKAVAAQVRLYGWKLRH